MTMSHWDLNELAAPEGHVHRTGPFKGRKFYEVTQTGMKFMEPKKVKYRERPLVFLDIETSGTDPVHSDILEIAIIRSDEETPYEQKLPLLRHQNATPEALQVVGYNDEEWQSAMPWGLVAQDVWDQLAQDSPAIIGHNITRFDWLFLEWRLRAMGFPTGLIGRPIVDTLGLAFARFYVSRDGPADSLSLDSLCVHYGIEPEGVHRALGGARRCREIYRRITAEGSLHG